jgi:TRAP-type C4-dicarboxylate transport system substrate-binding protein
MKNPSSIAIVCCMAIALLSPDSSAQAARTWKIGHVRPAGSAVDRDVRAFAETVTADTGGSLRFEIFSGNKLGDYSIVQERVSFGEVEMFVGPFGTAADRRLSLAFTPFLVRTWEQARRLYSPSSPLLAHMGKFLESQNIKILGGWPVYFGGIALTEEPPNPNDPDVSKNIIIRVPPIRSFELTARNLGYTPYPITWMYAKSGLKTGMVGGLIGGGAEGYKGLSGIIRYYLPVKDHFEYWFLYINLDVWKSLPDNQQAAIEQAAERMETQRYRVAEQDERANVSELRERGVEVLEMSDSTIEKMREKVKATVWPVLRKDVGPAFDEIVRFVDAGTR